MVCDCMETDLNIVVWVAHFLCIFIEFIPSLGILSKLAVTIDNYYTAFEEHDHR